MPYAGPERLLIGWLKTQITSGVGTDTPAKLAENVPFVQVVRIGGPDDDNDVTFEQPTVSVDCYATSRGDAEDLARQVHVLLRKALPGVTTGGATVSKVQTISGPAWRPWDDTTLRRFGASYALHLKAY